MPYSEHEPPILLSVTLPAIHSAFIIQPITCSVICYFFIFVVISVILKTANIKQYDI
jgi:hypothetical protein